jgi:hypothetical protein
VRQCKNPTHGQAHLFFLPTLKPITKKPKELAFTHHPKKNKFAFKN